MSKNQQKNTFNDASGLLNSYEGTASGVTNTLDAAIPGYTSQYEQALGTAQNAYNTPEISTLQDQEVTNLGGLDPTALKQLSDQYQDLISSGGISDATAAAMQRQAVSGVGSIYGTLENQLNKTRAATGGQGGGGEEAQMARQLSQQEANAITGVNAQVGQLRQQGTEAGLAGMSSLEAAQAQAQNAAAQTLSGTSLGLASGEAGLAGLTASQLDAIQSAALQAQQEQYLGEQGFLGSMSGIANNMQGPFGNMLALGNTLGSMAGGAGKLISSL